MNAHCCCCYCYYYYYYYYYYYQVKNCRILFEQSFIALADGK